MIKCTTLSYSDVFQDPSSDCIIINRCHFKSTNGCINVTSITGVSIRNTIFEEIVGKVSLIIVNVDNAELIKTCFTRCEYVNSKREDGSICKIDKSSKTKLEETSFFGCCTAFGAKENRYITYLKSSDLTLIKSNNSFNRAMRGTGVLISLSVIRNYSHCIYASGYCRGVSVYLQGFKQETTISNLIFVNNINFDENDEFQSIVFSGYGNDIDITIMNSYFVDNVAYVMFRTSSTNGRIISSKNVFSIAYSGIKNLGNVVMREEENTFITQLARSQPAGFDHLFACAIYDVKTKRKGARFNPIQYIAFFQTLLE